MSRLALRARSSRWAVIAAAVVVALSIAGCGGDDEEGSAADATGGVITETSTPAAPTEASVTPTASEETTDAGGAEVDALVAELEACFEQEGIEAETEVSDFPAYEEEAVIDLTFEYDAITVPGAVTLYVFATEEAAAKGKKAIDQDLLAGDSKTLLHGQVVVDDFGTTLQEPEAAEQAAAVHSCTA